MLMQTSQQAIIDDLRETHRVRTDFHRAEKGMTNRIKAVCRRMCIKRIVEDRVRSKASKNDKEETIRERILKQGTTEAEKLYKAMYGNGEHELAGEALGYLMPMFDARASLTTKRAEAEKALQKRAKDLSVWPWAESIRGVNSLSLGQIIAEAGDLNNYPRIEHLWKRMGMAVVNGERQRKKSGKEALDHGYDPNRRSIVWNVGESMIKQQIRRDKQTGESHAIGPYGELYKWRKATKGPKMAEQGCSDIHIHNEAKRYMEKQFLEDLYRAWHKV